MAHSHRDRQAKGILSRRLHEKAQIGARGPTSPRIPKLLSSTHTQATKLHSLVDILKLQKETKDPLPGQIELIIKNQTRTKEMFQ